MQMFNGLNMWMIKIYGLNFEDEVSENWVVDNVGENYQSKFDVINNNIRILSDGTIDDKDVTARTELNSMLNESFNSWLIGALNDDQKAQLCESIKNLLDSHNKEGNFQVEYKGLIDLAKALNIEWYNSVPESVVRPENLNFNWTLWEITPLEWDATPQWSLFSWLKREVPGNNENLEDDKNLYKTTENLKWQIDKIGVLLGNESLKDDVELKRIENWLKGALNVINNTTPDNVKKLQEFISENLTGQDREDFDKASKRGNDFDGRFWKWTLKWVNIILKRTGDYISGMEKFANNDIMSKITPNENVQKWETDPAKLLDGLPEGATVEFASDDEKNKLNTAWEQEIILKIKVWGNEYEKTVKITVVDSTSTISGASSQTTEVTPHTPPEVIPQSTTPLTLEGGQHQVVTLNPPLSWVTLYSPEVAEGNLTAWDDWKYETLQVTLNPNWDTEFLAKLDNSDNVYRMKVDSQWNLCPVMTEVWGNGEKVLLKNNDSCKKYLQNKLSGRVTNECVIWWNPNKEDYNIRSFGKGLTIEPMTIAWDWVVDWDEDPDHLSKSLALLNFTNFLRSGGVIPGTNVKLYGNDPDLKIDGNELKVRVEKTKDNWKWFDVPMDTFWLEGIDDGALKRFKKYNNHEEWRDKNWDKKKNNRYRKIDASGLWVQISDSSDSDDGDTDSWSSAQTVDNVPLSQDATTWSPSSGSISTDQVAVVNDPSWTPSETHDSPDVTGFESVDNVSDKLKIDEINTYVAEIIWDWKSILVSEDSKYKCNLNNVEEFLWKIWKSGGISFDKNFIRVWTPSRKAWLASVQILLNHLNSSDSSKQVAVDGAYKTGGETYTVVRAFQESYNKEKGLVKWNTWYLALDWIPGPMTIKAMLDKASSPTATDGADDNVPVVENGWQVATWEIDKANELWLTQADPQPNKGDLNIPDGSVVYTRAGEEDSLYYKGSDSKVYRISTNYPYQKTEVDSSLNDGNVSVNVCKAWANSLKIKFSDDEKVKWYLCDSESGAPNINVLVTDEGNYQLENGGVKIIINPNDPVYNSEGFCGVSVIYDRFKLVSLASIVKSKCEWNNVKYVSDKWIIVDGGDGSTEDVLASNDVLRAFWWIEGDWDIQSTSLDSFVSYCNGLKLWDQGDKAYVYSNETSAAI